MNKDNCTYLIKIRGQVDENEINPLSPVRLAVMRTGAGGTRLTCSTDQSGLIGLLQYLHGLGFVVLTVSRVEDTKGT